MAYADPQFNAPWQDSVVGSPSAPLTLGTTTASGTNNISVAAGTAGNGGYVFPKWIVPTKINNIRVFVGTAPASNLTNVTLFFVNGTTTFGTAVIGTNAANSFVDATLSTNTFGSTGALTNPCIFTSTNGQIAMTANGTATASGMAIGSYSIDIVRQNWFTT